MVRFGCGDKNFGLFWLTLVLIANCSFSLGKLNITHSNYFAIHLLNTGHTISIGASNINMAISLAAPILAIQMLFCGFFLQKV